MVVSQSMLLSQVISRQSGSLIALYAGLMGTEIDADESSVMFLANTTHLIEPEAHASALVFESELPYAEGEVN